MSNAGLVTIARFVIAGCGNVFGQGPCAATGVPCFNTWATCQSKCDHVCAPLEYWFSDCTLNASFAIPYYEIIQSCRLDPGKPNFGDAFYRRGSGSLVLCDIVDNGRRHDPYWKQRDVIEVCPQNMPGTFLGRFMARHKWLSGFRVEIYRGRQTDQLAQMRKEIYYVENVTGTPGRDGGSLTFKLQDPMMLLAGAKCPDDAPQLAATTATGSEFPAPFQLDALMVAEDDPDNDEPGPYDLVGQPMMNLNYLANNDTAQYFGDIFLICIGSELMRVRASINNNNPVGWNFVLLERAVCGTKLGRHEPGAKITAAFAVENQHVSEVVQRMLQKCADIEGLAEACCGDGPCLIDPLEFSQYQCENPYAVVCGPVAICDSRTTIDKHLDEISRSFGFLLHFDNRSGRVRMVNDAPPPAGTVIRTIDKRIMVNPTMKLKTAPLSSYKMMHTLKDWSAKLAASNTSDFTQALTADSLLPACERKTLKIPREKEVFTRWINKCNSFMAEVVTERRLRSLECGVWELEFDLPFDIAMTFEPLEYVRVSTDISQNTLGAPADNLWRILTISKGDDDCEHFCLESTAFTEFDVPEFTCLGTEQDTVLIETPESECKTPDNCVSLY